MPSELITRNRTLDQLKGFAILGMVFFSILLRITKELPDFLTHNVAGAVHMGDFVLSIFVFASGISTAFFMSKRIKNSTLVLDIIERFAMLAGISIMLSLFSSGAFFGMDEVMLIALMFILSSLFFYFSSYLNVIVSVLLTFVYYILVSKFGVAIFDSAYIGGYNGALFYLPLSLAGLVIGKGLVKNDKSSFKEVFVSSLAIFLITLLIFSIDKMRVSPSFIQLSAVFGVLCYAAFDRVKRVSKLSSILEYLGRNSLRYWILMFTLFLIPVSLYEIQMFSIKIFDWSTAILVSFLLLVLFVLISFAIDKLGLILKTHKNLTSKQP
ncbi:MAG: heparan-alpha-glucosaminide N-acetyltransferase domain-containing protein [Candidatus Micrarchaeota archaeon]|nr:heparan-alpha-glucosaminide N-acetyltransferase domain-containing protein [Candidatus Micrarchaeota archaeon]